MGFLRRSRAVPVRQRLTVSWWTSMGVTCLLLIAVFARSLTETNGQERSLENHGRHLDADAYPDDLIIEAKGNPRYSDASNKYLVFIHVILIGYMFLGLNTVCDIYFTGALDVMVDRWNVKPDVAGATFMAAGGSAPELFSSLIGVNYLSNDVGFSTIVGSAVFNVLFVIGLCGAVVSEPIPLTWWPLFRDCIYYMLGLTLLSIFAYTGNQIALGEAFVLFLGYILYCTIMYYNSNIESFVKACMYRAKTEDRAPSRPQDEPDKGCPCEVAEKGSSMTDSKEVVQDGLENFCPEEMAEKGGFMGTGKNVMYYNSNVDKSGDAILPRPEDEPDTVCLDEVADKGSSVNKGKEGTEGNLEECSDAEDDVDELMVMPEDTLARILWLFKLPIYGPLYYLTPKPTERKFMFTFSVSLLWIAGYSYLLIWWVDLIVSMISLDINVAGLTVLAAGTSIPDLVSSMAVARAGQGDMAVSSSIGSNIFDILVGLPLPWMIRMLIVEQDPEYAIGIQSAYIVVYVLILLFMVFCVIVSIHFLGWKLNKPLGMCMAFLYGVFMIIVLILEIGKPEWAKI